MNLLWHRHQHITDSLKEDKVSSVEVTKITRKGHQSAAKADKEIVKLNKLLKADGITLKIYIASRGHHG